MPASMPIPTAILPACRQALPAGFLIAALALLLAGLPALASALPDAPSRGASTAAAPALLALAAPSAQAVVTDAPASRGSPDAARSLAPHSPGTLAEANTAPGHGAGAATDDGAIIVEINNRIAGDPRLAGALIRVEAQAGSVRLSGTTPGSEGRQATEEVALQVEGVTRVDNHIQVPPASQDEPAAVSSGGGTLAALSSPGGEQPEAAGATVRVAESGKAMLKKTEEVASDSWITTKVRSAILADPVTRGSNVGVKTIEGVVSLTGMVPTQAEYDRLVQIVHGITGVKQVNTAGLETGTAE